MCKDSDLGHVKSDMSIRQLSGVIRYVPGYESGVERERPNLKKEI